MPRQFHRLRVTLLDSEPEVWRLFDIDASLSLRMLHLALQTTVGWRESHVHIFTDTDPQKRGAHDVRQWSDPYAMEGMDVESEEEVTIAEAFASSRPLWYEYDFGDGWLHRIDLIERGMMGDHQPPVTLVRGENRAPFEDSGGMPGYFQLREALAGPAHPEHTDVSQWVRHTVGPWAPTGTDFFDPIGVQSELNLLFNPAGAGTHPHDMSGLVKDELLRGERDVRLSSPIVDVASRLPVPIRSELRQHLLRSGVLELADVDPVEAGTVVRPYAWLLDAVDSTGLTLTAAGWMPPATVLDGMTVLGWADERIGKGNREDVTPPMRLLRESAQRIGLVRVRKNRLLLGADAKRAKGDSVALWHLIARRILRGLNDVETDASTLDLLALCDGTAEGDRVDAVAFGLDLLGWQTINGYGFTGREVAAATGRVQDVLVTLGTAMSPRGPGSRGLSGPELALFAREALR